MTCKRNIFWCAVVSVIAGSLGFSYAIAQDQVASEEGGAKLTVLCAGQLGGKLEPADCPTCGGGLAPRHSLVRSIMLAEDAVILVENGDLTETVGVDNELKFQATVLAMNEMGYDAFNIGEIDVRFGPRFLLNMSERAQFPFISANLAGPDGRTFFPSYAIAERKAGNENVRVGIIGVMSNQVGDYFAKIEGLDVTLLDARQAIRTSLDRLEGKADLRILLAHAGAEEALAWARSYPELDIVIYCHEAERPARNERSTGRQIIVNAGRHGEYLGRLDASPDGRGGFSHDYETLTVSAKLPDSPVVRKVLDGAMNTAVERGFVSRKAAEKPKKGGYYIGSEECAGCHLQQFGVWRKTRHSKAFARLENEGKESDPACLRCHATGYGFFTGFESKSKTPGLANVGCEVCHGVGSNHAENPTTRYGRTSRRRCKTCHNKENSPQFKYTSHYEKIAHKN